MLTESSDQETAATNYVDTSNDYDPAQTGDGSETPQDGETDPQDSDVQDSGEAGDGDSSEASGD